MLAVATTLGLGVQVPAVVAIGYVSRHYGLAAAGAALLSLPALTAIRRGHGQWHRSRWELYLGLWPFFAWWAICLAFLLFAPLAVAIATLSPVTLKTALLWAGAAAIVGGLRALRRRPRIIRHDIPVVNLPPALDGYRIAQISDLHCGPFVSAGQIDRWVARVNGLGADLIAVTGDLIASGDGYVSPVARALGGLRARDGAFACMGNHDYFTDGDVLAGALEGHGITVLRNRGVVIGRGAGRFFLAGVDDTWTGRHDLALALSQRSKHGDCPTVLLAHDPALFPAAVERGVDLTLSGHTHGGQIAFPLAPRRWNLARIITPFTGGFYRDGASSIYVNRGLGFTGPPVRFGAAPEIAVLTLRCAAAADSDLARVAS